MQSDHTHRLAFLILTRLLCLSKKGLGEILLGKPKQSIIKSK